MLSSAAWNGGHEVAGDFRDVEVESASTCLLIGGERRGGGADGQQCNNVWGQCWSQPAPRTFSTSPVGAGTARMGLEPAEQTAQLSFLFDAKSVTVSPRQVTL